MGTVLAVNENEDLQAVLVGNQQAIEDELSRLSYPPDRIDIHHSSQVVEMNESPAMSVRKKKDSSIMSATMLVKEGQAAGLVSCGNTGAQMAAALFGWGRFDGIERPAISALIPRNNGHTVMVDVGANVDVKPRQLAQFAIMGKLYAEVALGLANPRVGILSNGEEDTKGNQVTLEAFAIMSKIHNLNFAGNVEGRDLFSGRADVVVCDGFIGNTMIKVMEGLIILISERLNRAGIDTQSVLKDLDYTQIGGAPLLGVKGVSIVCHGSSRSQAVKNGILLAKRCVSGDMVSKLSQNLALLGIQNQD